MQFGSGLKRTVIRLTWCCRLAPWVALAELTLCALTFHFREHWNSPGKIPAPCALSQLCAGSAVVPRGALVQEQIMFRVRVSTVPLPIPPKIQASQNQIWGISLTGLFCTLAVLGCNTGWSVLWIRAASEAVAFYPRAALVPGVVHKGDFKAILFLNSYTSGIPVIQFTGSVIFLIWLFRDVSEIAYGVVVFTRSKALRIWSNVNMYGIALVLGVGSQ